MFEYHGWITIHDSPGDDDETRLAVIVESLRHRIEAIDSPYLLDLRWMNGEAFVHLGGFSNHASPEIADFFRHVGSVAPGSYGLLHVRDDEDPRHGNEYENGVRVLRMARGDRGAPVPVHPDHRGRSRVSARTEAERKADTDP